MVGWTIGNGIGIGCRYASKQVVVVLNFLVELVLERSLFCGV